MFGEEVECLRYPLCVDALSTQAVDVVTVTFCSRVSSGSCGGACTVVTASPTCISAPGTNCLMATLNEVEFCDHGDCGGICNRVDPCGTHLQGNFCDTPGTNSISIPNGGYLSTTGGTRVSCWHAFMNCVPRICSSVCSIYQEMAPTVQGFSSSDNCIIKCITGFSFSNLSPYILEQF